MGKIAAYLLIGVGVGISFAWWQGFGAANEDFGAGIAVEDRAPLERRLSELETSLALERYERQSLADELEALRVTVAARAADADGGARGDPRERIASLLESGNTDSPVAERIRERFPDGLPQSRDEIERMMEQRQIDRFVAAGLAPDRAQWIMQREDELAMEVLQARYAAAQNGASEQEVQQIGTAQLLRKELGDAEYEKYLAGQGRPTSINVRDVLTNSPAQSAGLRAGDEIVAYNGQRVFDINELNDLTYQAKPGGTVALQVIRDGQTMQVYVDSGPIGISGGGRPTRRGTDGGGAAGGFGGRGAQGGFGGGR